MAEDLKKMYRTIRGGKWSLTMVRYIFFRSSAILFSLLD